MTVAPLYASNYAPIIARALDEDFGQAGDITTDAIVAPDTQASANIAARREGRLAGLDVALAVFTTLDPSVTVEHGHRDGEDVAAGATLAVVSGAARVLLSGERTALNLLGRMSGIATTTRDAAK